MYRFLTAIRFIIISLAINFIIFSFATINGYMNIYDFILNLSLNEVNIADDSYTSYNFLNKYVKRNQLYVVNEIPEVSLDYDFFLYNIKFYKTRADIKYVIMDVSYAAGEWLNLCLENNDVELLQNTILNLGDSNLNSNEFYSFFKKLIAYNNTLDVKQRLKIVGFAPERNKDVTTAYINYLYKQVEKKKKPDYITALFKAVPLNYSNIALSLNENDLAYRELFVDKYFNFKMALDNYISTIDKVQNFISVFNHNIRSKYFGQFSDVSFCSQLESDYKIYIQQIYKNDATKSFYLLDNTFMKYFEKYREFVYKINGRSVVVNDNN